MVTIFDMVRRCRLHKDELVGTGMKLVCYEGGQHCTSGADSVNRDPRMYNLYMTYFDAMNKVIEGIFCHYTHTSMYSSSGAWGAVEYTGQPISIAHKFRAIVDWIAVNPAGIAGPKYLQGPTQGPTYIQAPTFRPINTSSTYSFLSTSAHTPSSNPGSGLIPTHLSTGDTLRVYFIGNSVTDSINYSGLDNLATSRGYDHVWGRHIIPGAPLSWIWDHPGDGYSESPYGFYPNALQNYTWDVLNLQPFDR